MADKGDKKKGKDKKGKAGAGNANGLQIKSHPGAMRAIQTAKGWGGLMGFLIVFFLSKRTGVPFYWAAIRGVLGGFAGMLAAWMATLTFWREVLVARVEAARIEAMKEAEKGAGS